MEQFNLGTRVLELLEQRNIKPVDFYKDIGITAQNFYDWKKKGASPNAMTALKVAKYLGVTVEYLLTGEEENPLQIVVEEQRQKYENLKKTMLKVIQNN